MVKTPGRKKKYAILTINDIDNYGNRLQNYALQEVLNHFGDVTTIRFETVAPTRFRTFKARLRRPKMYILSLIKCGLSRGKNPNAKKTLKNLQFTRNRVPDNRLFMTSYRRIPTQNIPDKIVIGSDQVWNYQWLSQEDLRVRLGFTLPADHVLTYAASIGVSEIPSDYRSTFKQALERIPSISVREDKAKELVENVSDNIATVVLDPTLLIPQKQWVTLFKGFVHANDRYVLTYFLGKPSTSQESFIQKYAKSHNLRVRRILDLRDRETYSAGPEDFVELFSKASFIFTDSYHACCFSIIFNKGFKVFDRTGQTGTKNMNSRMQTLFRIFQLEDLMADESQINDIDYAHINQLLERHRIESNHWLQLALQS